MTGVRMPVDPQVDLETVAAGSVPWVATDLRGHPCVGSWAYWGQHLGLAERSMPAYRWFYFADGTYLGIDPLMTPMLGMGSYVEFTIGA